MNREDAALELMKALILSEGGPKTDDDMYNCAMLAVKGADRLRKVLGNA